AAGQPAPAVPRPDLNNFGYFNSAMPQNRYQLGGQFGNVGGQFGIQGGIGGQLGGNTANINGQIMQLNDPNNPMANNRRNFEQVHAKFPLLSLRFRNSATQPLMQGPMTVYEGAGYAGDSRCQDLQPGEERLLSYALDLGTEVKAEGHSGTDQLDAVKVVKGILQATHKLRQTRS